MNIDSLNNRMDDTSFFIDALGNTVHVEDYVISFHQDNVKPFIIYKITGDRSQVIGLDGKKVTHLKNKNFIKDFGSINEETRHILKKNLKKELSKNKSASIKRFVLYIFHDISNDDIGFGVRRFEDLTNKNIIASIEASDLEEPNLKKFYASDSKDRKISNKGFLLNSGFDKDKVKLFKKSEFFLSKDIFNRFFPKDVDKIEMSFIIKSQRNDERCYNDLSYICNQFTLFNSILGNHFKRESNKWNGKSIVRLRNPSKSLFDRLDVGKLDLFPIWESEIKKSSLKEAYFLDHYACLKYPSYPIMLISFPLFNITNDDKMNIMKFDNDSWNEWDNAMIKISKALEKSLELFKNI